VAIGLVGRLVEGGKWFVPTVILIAASTALVSDRHAQSSALIPRRVIATLHGGQLIMLVLLIGVIGLGAIWIGNTPYIAPSNASFSLALGAREGPIGNTGITTGPENCGRDTYSGFSRRSRRHRT
jgi:hypothetical protein